MDSWERLACYPQGSFYPLSDGPSTRHHRITKPDFRPCSTCPSRSQAPFCLCTLRAVSVRAEGTFGRLRYSFGGDRPSQTARLTLSRISLLSRLEFQYIKGGIPTSAPARLASSFPSLPPILYVMYQNPMSGYSKAPWGLSVQSRVTCIFTGISISPGPSLRQCPNRYTFRAGRNLPDKEFRYLRTVIVTAAVHWGFGRMLWLPGHPSLTFQHWAGVSTYTSAFALAGTCVYGKQSLGPLLCDHSMLHPHGTSQQWLPLSRSYGYILPSSLTRVLPRTLGFSPRIPVSVYGTGGSSLTRSFSRQCGVNNFARISAHSASRLRLSVHGFAYAPPYTLTHALPFACLPALLCHSIAQTITTGTGISTSCPSPTLSASD